MTKFKEIQLKLEEKAYKTFLLESELTNTSTNKKIFSNPSIKKQYLLKVYGFYLEESKLQDSLEINMKSEDNFNVISDKYPSLSSFSLEVLRVFREKGIEINPQDFLTVFSIIREYEDDYIKVTFNEEEKIGRIEFKDIN